MSPEQIDGYLAAMTWKKANEQLAETLNANMQPWLDVIEEWRRNFVAMVGVPPAPTHTYFCQPRRAGKSFTMTYIDESHILVQPLPVERKERVDLDRFHARTMEVIQALAEGRVPEAPRW